MGCEVREGPEEWGWWPHAVLLCPAPGCDLCISYLIEHTSHFNDMGTVIHLTGRKTEDESYAQGQRIEIPSQDFLMLDKSSLCLDPTPCHPSGLDSARGRWCQPEILAALLQLPGNSELCCHIEGGIPEVVNSKKGTAQPLSTSGC